MFCNSRSSTSTALRLPTLVPVASSKERRARDGLNKSVDYSSTHRELSRADGLFRVSLGLRIPQRSVATRALVLAVGLSGPGGSHGEDSCRT